MAEYAAYKKSLKYKFKKLFEDEKEVIKNEKHLPPLGEDVTTVTGEGNNAQE